MTRSRHFLLLTALVHPTCVAAQDTPPPILSQAVSRHDWEISGVGAVRFGRVALVDAVDGARLELRRLGETAPTSQRPSMESVRPNFSGNNLIVSDFAQGNRTPLGGYFGTFQRQPSIAHGTVGQMSDGRRALELTCHHQAAGFCGLWVQLYDFEAPPEGRRYLDARAFSTMSFWIRGRQGGERVLLKVADAVWEQREDALPIGDVSEFLPTGRMDTEWQQAVIPMDRLPSRIRRAMLAMIAFEATAAGTTIVEVGPMAFSLTPDSLPPLPQREDTDRPTGLLHKATWVWNTAELVDAPDRRTSLLGFLEQEGVDHVFLQLTGVPGRPSLPGELAIDADAMRPLVAAFTARGIRVYALDGYARYALPEFREGVLATIDHVAQYNRRVLPHERFYGVRYDIEPYLLPAFHGPNRARLLTGLLELTAASVERAHAAGLVYGADIPFWYDALSEETQEPVTVEFGGAVKPVSEHVIDLVDDVAIMDYRTTAYGADGIVRHGSAELRYAATRGKSVFIALETFALPDETLLDFRGEPNVGQPAAFLPEPMVVVAAGTDSIYVALLQEPAAGNTPPEALEHWIAQHQLDPRMLWWWPVSKRVHVPAGKITFANHDPHLLDQVMRATTEEFRRYDSFAGFAIHYAQSYRALLGR
ncbi:MAG: hypothetical protein OER90_02490 [Gemmatimonadota bacterium]|nr:hypothetical protein [Gemmatimonadota bacterium]